jgi:hypothetical protein
MTRRSTVETAGCPKCDCTSSAACPALAAMRLSGPPAIAHSNFETAKELGWFDIERSGDLNQSSNVGTSQAALNHADRGSVCTHLPSQPVLARATHDLQRVRP